jgi:hypothetical protein
MTSAVQDSPDVRRVAALPRREWAPDQAALLAERMTAALRTPGGSWTLRPVQAVALAELAQGPGALLPIRVGGGKTLISLLAGTVTGARRPLLLLPAHLREKTLREYSELREHWRLPGYVRIESYQQLSTAASATMLEDYAPDLLICDEAHYLKNPKAACTRRVRRYMEAAGPDCRFVAMSGTITKRSIKDFAHLALWALHTGSPAPTHYRAIEEWSLALDAKVPDGRRLDPGALARLGRFRDRLVQTPGVVATQEAPLPIPLVIRGELLEVPPVCERALAQLRETWETPDGHPLTDGISAWRHAQELALGFYYRWNPRPPDWWLLPRKAWAGTCREVLATNRRNLDTEYQVVLAVRDGFYPHAREVLDAWHSVRDRFEPNVEPVWLSDHAVNRIASWMAEGPGIVWTAHRALGHRFGALYYGAEGLNSEGRPIESHPPNVPLVASVAANGTGRNLQAWNRNLIASAPPSGSTWEQLLGRTHREGQRAPEVSADVLLGCVESLDGFWRAVDDAAYAEEVTGQAQKLTHADTDGVPDTAPTFGAQWVRLP